MKTQEKLLAPIFSSFSTCFAIMQAKDFKNPLDTIRRATEWAIEITEYLLSCDVISLDEYNRIVFMANDIQDRATKKYTTDV